MSKSELERQTDRTVAASRKQTAAIRDQTRAINKGFSQTVEALHTQTGVLRSVDFGVRAVAHELRGLREDIYAATQNREALEAKSKIERAEQLLTSDLPADALRLLREAEVLNPADFAVWSMKVMFCRHAIENGVDCMTADEARQEGAAAIERVVKLYPAAYLGSERSLHVLQWLAGSAILLASQPGFERATALFAQSVDAGGEALALNPPTMTMSRFLEDVGQGGHARDVALANGRLLARIAASGDDGARRAIVPAWIELVETYPDAVGPEVEAAIVAGARGALVAFVEAVSAADQQHGWIVSSPARRSRSTVESWLAKLEAPGGALIVSVREWRDALTDPNLVHLQLTEVRRSLDDIATQWDPTGWRSVMATLAEPPTPVSGGVTMFTVLLAFWGVSCMGSGISIIQKPDENVIAALVFMGGGGLTCFALAARPHLRYHLNRRKPLPSPNTTEFVQGIRDHIERWKAAAAR